MADCYEGSMGAIFRFVITNVMVNIGLVENNKYAHIHKPDKSRRKAWGVCIRFPLHWSFLFYQKIMSGFQLYDIAIYWLWLVLKAIFKIIFVSFH